jgi:hypothetical protein
MVVSHPHGRWREIVRQGLRHRRQVDETLPEREARIGLAAGEGALGADHRPDPRQQDLLGAAVREELRKWSAGEA